MGDNYFFEKEKPRTEEEVPREMATLVCGNLSHSLCLWEIFLKKLI